MTRPDLPDLPDVEDALRTALATEARGIQPSDRLEAIRATLAAESPTTGGRVRSWVLSLAAAAAAVGLLAGVLQGHGAPSSAATGGGTSATGSSDSASTSAIPGATWSALPVYYLVPTTVRLDHWVLARTFIRPAPTVGAAPADRIKAALHRVFHDGTLYPIADAAPPWEDMGVVDATVTPDLITLTLATGGHAGVWSRDVEERTVSMFVWTAQAAVGAGRIPVTFRLANGQSTLFGHMPAAQRYDRPNSDQLADVLAPIWIDGPGAGEVILAGQPVRLHGLTLAPKQVLQWSLTGSAGGVPVEGSVQADTTRPQSAFAVDLGVLAPGTYTIRMRTSPVRAGDIGTMVTFEVGT